MKKPRLVRGCLVVLTLCCFAGRVAAQDEPGSPPPSEIPPRPGYVLVDDMWLPASVLGGTEATFQATPWPNGIVYIAFSPTFSTSQVNALRTAFAEIQAVCGANFVEVPTSFGSDHVLVLPNPGYPHVGNSDVGRLGGEQYIHLGSSFFDEGSKYAVVHELMHTLGFMHEQQRPDRDFYVTILWGNISQDQCSGSPCDNNFDLLGSSAIVTGAYDFQSIMHYRDDSFGIGDSLTIVCNAGQTQHQSEMGNRSFFSQGDVAGLQAWYGAATAPVINTVVPNAVESTTVTSLIITVNGQNFFDGSFTSQQGVQGTRVRFDGNVLDTTFVSQTQITAVVPGSMLFFTGSHSVDVFNPAVAGGSSVSSVTFTVLPPPCQSNLDRIGLAVAGLGDVNGDGKADYAVGSPGWQNDQGRVVVYSGATGAPIWSTTGLSNGTQAGSALAAMADINGDGRKDLLIGSPGWNSNAGKLEIRSGATGAILTILNNGTTLEAWGWSCAGVGDIDGDGDEDFAVGKPGYANNTGQVQIWSSNGGLMRTHNGSVAGDRFGHAVSGGFDVNLDGAPDYVIGAPEKTINSVSNVGRIYVYSGATGALIVSKDGDGQYDRFGWDVALIPTTGTSGPYGQILVGAPEIPNVFSGSGNGPGYVRLFHHSSLLTSWATLATWTGTAVGDHYGISVASAGDMNDDGYPDILIGIPQSTTLTPSIGPGGFDIRSGKSPFDVIYHYQGSPVDEQLGYSVDAAGDTDGDQRLDVIAGAPGSDIGCFDAGAFFVVRPPIPPEQNKVMITEVSTGDPDCVEITNFGESAVSLSNWKVRWKDGVVHDSAPLNVTIAAGETIVVSETASLPECPAGVQVLAVLGSVSTTLGDVAVGLVSNRNVTVDEVHLESNLGTYTEGSLGGFFRGIVIQDTTISSQVNAERIWGLDSNAGRDWTTGAPRSMGLQNRSSGPTRGTDPISLHRVSINETDDNGDYIELHRPSSSLAGSPFELQGWYLLASAGQNLAHVKLTPFPTSRLIAPGGYLVIGDIAAAPNELASGVPYVNLSTIGGGNIPWVGTEYDCALYDSYGRLVDCMRSTAPNVTVVHNHPRAPSHWSDFTGAAPRSSAGDGAIGRNAHGTDTNTGGDFQPKAVRTMGSANTSGPDFNPNGHAQLDVVLNDARGGGFTCILNGGPDRQGARWTFTGSAGHLHGTGPVLGLGSDAYANWFSLSSTPPFFGFLDATGSARLDFPAGTFPPGFQADLLFVLQEGATAASPFALISNILEFDS